MLSPFRYFESLEKSRSSSVESDISHSLVQGDWMEMLSIDVPVNWRLSIEFVLVELINSDSGSLAGVHMEAISESSPVWSHESHET